MPHSFFHFDSSPSFSLPAGMDMNQAATMNSMMQPVSILGQQSFGAPQSNFRPVTEDDLVGTDGMSASQIVDIINQPDYETPAPPAAEPQSRILDFGQGILDLLKGTVENVATAPVSLGQFGMAGFDYLANPSRPSFGDSYSAAQRKLPFEFFDENPYAEPVTSPSSIPMGPQTQESISPFLESPDTPSGLGGPLLSGFNMVNEAARGPNAPMGRDATRAMLQERFGAPTISAIQSLPSGQGLGMRTDAQGRMISQGDDRTAFDQASLDRLARLEQRDVRPGETQTERDTRIADSRTEGTDRGGEMSFEEARKFVPKGSREKTKDYNERVKAYQAQQNSAISQLKEQYEQFRVQGQVLNNQRIQAYIAQYQQTEPEKYRETLQVAQEMLRDGILQDEVQVAMYVIDQMGGKSADIFDPATAFMGGDDGGASTYTPEQETTIQRVLERYPNLSREQAIAALQEQGRF
jgi:hypothetical protein